MAIYSWPRAKRCGVCGTQVARFLPYRGGWESLPNLMQALDIVGSDVENFECPSCGSHDRERHLLLYLSATGLLSDLRGKNVLHFAPERRLPKKILDVAPACYVKCDLYPQEPGMVRVDMVSMPFPDSSFDMVIANHVLEHVDNDIAALSEIRRVLRVGGHAILQTPFCRKLHRTWEDAGITDEKSRLEAFGQEDHVRLYGRDIFERFSSAGLESRVIAHHDALGQIDAGASGVNPEEPLFLFQRSR